MASKIKTNQLFKEYGKILKHLRHCKHDICNYIIKNSDRGLVECFRRIVINILHKKIKIPKRKINKLLSFKDQLLTVASSKKSLKHKKQALQTGGFISALLSTVATLLPTIISLVKK